jgi:hypothetical protein
MGLLGPHSLVLESVQGVRGLSPQGVSSSSGLLGEGMLRLELQQALEGAAGSLAELAYRASVQTRVSGTRTAHMGRADEDPDPFLFSRSALLQLQRREESGTRMVTVKSVSTRDSLEKSREGSSRQESRASRVTGLVAQLVQELRSAGHHDYRHDREDGRASVLSALEYAESPLAKLKRAGLGLLSQGFGAFGFGSGGASSAGPSILNPADNPVVVVFVAGGICEREIAQARRVLSGSSEICAHDGPRIVFASNRTLDSPELAAGLFSGLL